MSDLPQATLDSFEFYAAVDDEYEESGNPTGLRGTLILTRSDAPLRVQMDVQMRLEDFPNARLGQMERWMVVMLHRWLGDVMEQFPPNNV
jgi:hypothetical protein